MTGGVFVTILPWHQEAFSSGVFCLQPFRLPWDPCCSWQVEWWWAAGECWASVWGVWVLNPVLHPHSSCQARALQRSTVDECTQWGEGVLQCLCTVLPASLDKWAKGHPGLAGLWQDCWLSCDFLMLGSPNLTGGKRHQRWDNRDQVYPEAAGEV